MGSMILNECIDVSSTLNIFFLSYFYIQIYSLSYPHSDTVHWHTSFPHIHAHPQKEDGTQAVEANKLRAHTCPHVDAYPGRKTQHLFHPLC